MNQLFRDFLALVIGAVVVLAIQDSFAFDRKPRHEAEKKLEACYSSCYSRCVK